MKYDFSGYATKNDLKCTDKRTIRKDAFKEDDGKIVPLVWQHMHNDPANVLGHAKLENREDGVYCYGFLNETESGKNAKELLKHGDIKSMSIWANQLVQKGNDVIHGVIKEVSLVLSPANPGAVIDNLSIAHADGSVTDLDDEAIINYNLQPSFNNGQLEHKDDGDEDDETIGDIFNTLNEKQKNAVYYMLSQALEGEEVQHGEEGENNMKVNVFDKGKKKDDQEKTLSHSDFMEIVEDAKKCGSLKESFLAHAQEYGIENIDILFPDAKTVTNPPDFIKRDTEWVSSVLNGVRHSPFSRIKSTAADITADEARARGYVKGNLKKEEVIKLLKRVTTPTTIYKKQKLDRDDIIDITDLNVVTWLKAEMRMMLDEELARAILIGDGREADSEDKINEENIRPIWKDEDMYSHHVTVDADTEPDALIEAIIRARKEYKGSGSPAFYTTTEVLIDMLLLKDKIGRRLYSTQAELTSALGVSKIVEVPVMEGQTRVVDGETRELIGLVVNLKDYTAGADKGGEVSMFDDFDIDYNQYKYLIETRCSGTLTHPKSALVFEKAVKTTTPDTPEEP